MPIDRMKKIINFIYYVYLFLYAYLSLCKNTILIIKYIQVAIHKYAEYIFFFPYIMSYLTIKQEEFVIKLI